MIMIKNILFVLVLLYSAYSDYKYRIIPDKIHIIIILIGLININILYLILGLILISSSPFVIAITKMV